VVSVGEMSVVVVSSVGVGGMSVMVGEYSMMVLVGGVGVGGGETTIMVPLEGGGVVDVSVVVGVSVGSGGARGCMLDGIDGVRHAGALEVSR